MKKRKSSLRFTFETLFMITAFVGVTYWVLMQGLERLEAAYSKQTEQTEKEK